MHREVFRLAKRYMEKYELIRTSSDEPVPGLVEQGYIEVVPARKISVLKRILDGEFYGIIFCQTKRETRILSEKLARMGYSAEALNGDMSERSRERTLMRFKRLKITF